MAEVTGGTLFRGRVTLLQPPRGEGYRANVDALLLAAFAANKRARHGFDLGSGVGAVALALAHLGGAERVTLVELDATAAALARRNLDDNGLGARGEVVCGDVLEAARARRGEADLVVCNPPYVAPGRGRVPQGDARAAARSGDLTRFVEAARLACGRRARACFVYPAPELVSLVGLLRAWGLEPKRLRFVHATASRDARVVLVEAVPGKPGGLSIEPPLVERDGAGYSSELRHLLDG